MYICMQVYFLPDVNSCLFAFSFLFCGGILENFPPLMFTYPLILPLLQSTTQQAPCYSGFYHLSDLSSVMFPEQQIQEHRYRCILWGFAPSDLLISALCPVLAYYYLNFLHSSFFEERWHICFSVGQVKCRMQ